MAQQTGPTPTAATGGRERLTRAQRELVEANLGVARALARRYRGRGVEVDDLEQVAMLALVRAARRFDPANGTAFSTYAFTCVLGELKRYFRDHAWVMRVPRRAQELYLRIKQANEELRHRLGRSPTISELADDLGATEEAVLEAMEAGASFYPASLDAPQNQDGVPLVEAVGSESVAHPESAVDRVALQAYLPKLPFQEQQLLKLLFLDERTQADAGREIGVSQMQVSRLLARLLTKIRLDLVTDT